MNNLSDRLKLIADLVVPGESVADIGTDHGFVPIHLLAENIVPFAILTDVNQGPIDIAASHIKEVGINDMLYDLRCGDGLQTIKEGEVSTVIIAGMGGELIENILDEDSVKSHSFKRLVLQPRTHANELRYFLTNNAFEFVDYRLVKEKFRICEIFVVQPTDAGKVQPDHDLISKFLIEKKDPLLKEFIDYKINSTKTVLNSLENSDNEDSKSQKDIFNVILKELTDIKESINED